MQVWVESCEGSIYLAKAGTEQQQDWLRDERGMPKKFRSLEAVRRHFAGQKIQQAWLIQHNPYGEMIGLSTDLVEPARIPLYWSTTDV